MKACREEEGTEDGGAQGGLLHRGPLAAYSGTAGIFRRAGVKKGG